MSEKYLNIYFKTENNIVNDVLKNIIEFCHKNNITEKFFDTNRPSAKKNLSELVDAIIKKKVDSFDIISEDETQEFGYHYYSENMNLLYYSLGKMLIQNAETLVSQFIKSSTFFSSGFLNTDYCFYQNERRLKNLKERGIGVEKLSIYKHQLLDEYWIDISKNPGRFEQRNCYLEVVSSLMYISKNFINLTGADIQKVKHLEWAKVDEVYPGVYRIESWPQPFDSDEGEQRMRQETLRKLLYPVSYP